jgi:Rieske Fe-S protein
MAAFASMVSRHARASRRPHRLSIPLDRLDSVTFVDEVIVCRVDGTVKVFAARCPHLGCRITQMSGDLLVCPCHGSKFRSDGSLVSGPASRPLDPLPHESDPQTGALVVHVS